MPCEFLFFATYIIIYCISGASDPGRQLSTQYFGKLLFGEKILGQKGKMNFSNFWIFQMKTSSSLSELIAAFISWSKYKLWCLSHLKPIKSNASQKDIKIHSGNAMIRRLWLKRRDLWANRVGERSNFISFRDAYDFISNIFTYFQW